MNSKTLLGMLAVAGTLLSAASCSQEERLEVPATGEEAQVSFSLGLEGGIATRAISDGTSVNTLYYAIYNANDEAELITSINGSENGLLTKENAFASGLTETVTVNLAKGQTYTAVFWAQAAACDAYALDVKANSFDVTVSYEDAENNDENRDAFYAAKTFTVSGSAEHTVTLTRPFAQVNVGVTEADWTAAVEAGVVVEESSVVISNVATDINLLTGEVSGEEEVTYSFASIPSDKLNVDADGDGTKEAYHWLSMSYILAAAEKTVVDDLSFTFSPAEGDDITFSEGLNNVPVQRNWRTNILGTILTGNIKFNIVIDPEYDNENNLDVDEFVESEDDLVAALKAAVAAGETEIEIYAGEEEITLNATLTTTLVPEGTTVTIHNANVTGRSYGNKVDGTVIFENCTFNNASGAYSINFDGGSGDIVFNNCTLYGWCSFGSTHNSVSFNDCTLYGNGTYALIRSYCDMTMTDCTIDTRKTNATDKWREGVEVSLQYGEPTLTMTGCKWVEADGVSYDVKASEYTYSAEIVDEAGDAGLTGLRAFAVKDAATVSSQEGLIYALGQGAETVYLEEGNYTNFHGSDMASGATSVTIIGKDKENCKIELTASLYFNNGATVSLKNLTYTVPAGLTYDESHFAFIHRAAEVNISDCIIKGSLRLDSNKATIENCEFVNETDSGFDGYGLFYYGNSGSKVTVSNCSFDMVSKAIVMYNESKNVYDLTVSDCTFTASTTDDKAAIQMHTECGISGELTINNCTASGFYNVNGGLWNEVNNSTKAETNNFNIYVDGSLVHSAE